MQQQALGVYEPTLATVFLPRCPHCGGKHPLAYDPPLPADICPTCLRTPAPPGGTVEVPAVITGRSPAALAARACFAIARRLVEIWRNSRSRID